MLDRDDINNINKWQIQMQPFPVEEKDSLNLEPPSSEPLLSAQRLQIFKQNLKA